MARSGYNNTTTKRTEYQYSGMRADHLSPAEVKALINIQIDNIDQPMPQAVTAEFYNTRIDSDSTACHDYGHDVTQTRYTGGLSLKKVKAPNHRRDYTVLFERYNTDDEDWVYQDMTTLHRHHSALEGSSYEGCTQVELSGFINFSPIVLMFCQESPEFKAEFVSNFTKGSTKGDERSAFVAAFSSVVGQVDDNQRLQMAHNLNKKLAKKDATSENPVIRLKHGFMTALQESLRDTAESGRLYDSIGTREELGQLKKFGGNLFTVVCGAIKATIRALFSPKHIQSSSANTCVTVFKAASVAAKAPAEPVVNAAKTRSHKGSAASRCAMGF